MGKIHKSLTLTLWAVFIFLLLQFIFFYQYYKDVPKMKREITKMNDDVTHTQERINMLKKALEEKNKRVQGEEHARSVYMMQKKDEKLYKYLDL